MTKSHRRRAGIVAAVIVLLVTISPVLLVVWAGASGSVGDLSQVKVLPVGVALPILLAAVAGIATSRGFARVAADPTKGSLDGWAAFVLGLGAYILIVTLIPMVITQMMLPGETESLDDRLAWIGLVYVGGHVLAALLGIWAGSGFIGRAGDAAGDDPEQAEPVANRLT